MQNIITFAMIELYHSIPQHEKRRERCERKEANGAALPKKIARFFHALLCMIIWHLWPDLLAFLTSQNYKA